MVFPNFEKVGSAALICDSYCFMFLKFAFSHKELRLTYMFSTIALEGILCILNFKDHLFCRRNRAHVEKGIQQQNILIKHCYIKNRS